MKILTAIQWEILDTLAGGDEPFEAIDQQLGGVKTGINPDEILASLFELYKSDYITIKQIPISPLKQSFKEKDIMPNNPHEMLGDLEQFYEQYCEKRDYLWEANIGGVTGIPFGIWFEMTQNGRNEWSKPDYKKYYEKNITG